MSLQILLTLSTLSTPVGEKPEGCTEEESLLGAVTSCYGFRSALFYPIG